MQRFVDTYKMKEENSNFLETLFKNPVNDNKKLFFYGALKEFEELGVSVFQPEEKPVAKVIKKESPSKVETKVVVKKKAVAIKKEKVVVQKKKVKARTQKRKSALAIAVDEYLKKNKPVTVDLKQAKAEFSFPKALVQKFNGPLRPFQTLKALKEMKKNDILGSIQTPFSYVFLRYMLDFELHQGLFNLTSVLGNQFYIVDDIEKKKKPIKVRLLNSKQTNYKWKLEIVEATK